ncbi:MAG: M1 family aminopeptidase, partial [Terriglobia bacterium]
RAQYPGERAAEELRWPWSDPRAELHWPRSRTYDLQHVKVEVTRIDWEKEEIQATVTLRLAPLNDGLERVELDAAELTLERVALANGQPLEFASEDEKLVVTLDRAYAEGETLELVIRYRARPRKGLYFRRPDEAYPNKPRQVWSQGESEYNHYWIPLYDFPNDKATTEMIVTVPDEFMVISNGELVETRRNRPPTTTFHWRENVPHSTYLISLIVGQFDHHQDTLDGLPVDYYVPPGTPKEMVARSFEQTAAMIRFFNDYIGIAYPYEQYAQTTVEEFLWGGMENVSATTLFTDTLHPAEAAPNWSSEGLVAHELAHQWWGDLLTTRSWAHIWLNESFATFFTNLWFEHQHGRAAYDYERWKDMQDYFCEDDAGHSPACVGGVHYRRPIVWPIYVDEMDLFDRHTYPKGGLVLHMLRALLGEEPFRRALHHYGTKFARQPVDTEDFRKAIAEATGRELGWFFRQWLYRAGHPELRVQAEWDPQAKSLHLAVEQTQERRELTPLFRLPLAVEFTTSEGAQRFPLVVEHQRDDFYFSLPERPERIRFDPDQDVLKKLDFARTREELIDLLRNDPNVIGRIWAAEQLGRRRNDLVALAALREALHNDGFYGVRAEAARVLAGSRSPTARDALLEGLNDPDARVREQVARGLGSFAGEATVARALENLLAHEEKTYVVAAALQSLAQVQPENAFERLRGALERDSHREVLRRAALEGLSSLEDERALPLVLEWTDYGRP